MAAASPRAPVSWLLIPLIIGYLTADFLPHLPGVFAFAGLFLGLFSLLSLFFNDRIAKFLWPVLILFAAIFLAAGYLQIRLKPPPEWSDLPPREAVLTLRIDRLYPSSIEEDRIHGFATIRKTESHMDELKGRKIYFSMIPDPENRLWPKATEIPVAGILEALPKKPKDGFHRHLSRSGAQFKLQRATLRGKPIAGTGVFAFFERQNRRFELFLRAGSSKESGIADVYVAMLLGKPSALTKEQEQIFRLSGALHLFAISGLHIGVIAFALHSLLTLLRLPPKAATIFGLFFLLVFVGITGASPSAMRAFLMISFFWSARFFNRVSNPIAALANSALLVLLIYPGQLWNAGFQLSYVVVTGILFLGLPLGQHLEKKWILFSDIPEETLTPVERALQWLMKQIANTLAISLSATLLSSPLTIHYFGIFAPGAVLLNLLLIPLASLVLIAGFLSILLNLMMLGFLSALYNHAAWMILIAMEQIARTTLRLPLFWEAAFMKNWLGPFSLLLLLTALFLCKSKRWEAPFYHYVVPFLIFVLLLATGVRLTFPGE